MQLFGKNYKAAHAKLPDKPAQLPLIVEDGKLPKLRFVALKLCDISGAAFPCCCQDFSCPQDGRQRSAWFWDNCKAELRTEKNFCSTPALLWLQFGCYHSAML